MDEPPEERLKRIAQPADLVMKMVETERRDGEPPRSISFVGIEFKPLAYAQLADARLHLPAKERACAPGGWSAAASCGRRRRTAR